MTLLETILLLGRDGFLVSFQSEGDRHCVALYHAGRPHVEGKHAALPVLDLPFYYTTAEATDERLSLALLALAIQR